MKKIPEIILMSMGAVSVLMTFVILGALYAHSTKVDEGRICRTETGHKKVPCPVPQRQ